MSKFIIGGGMAGLISAYYKKDFQLVSQDIGGQFNKDLGPRILELNQNSTNFLQDLNISTSNIKTAKIGYRVNNKLVDSIDEELRFKYYLKSRCLKESKELPSSIMSDGKNKIDYYDIDWNQAIHKLHNNINKPIIGIITKIDLINQTITVQNLNHRSKKVLKYEELISTLPAPIFYKLANIEPLEKFEFASKTFVIVSSSHIDMGDYDYVYYPEDKYVFHRITKIKKDRLAIEYTSKRQAIDLKNGWERFAFNTFSLFVGQIQKGKVTNIPNVTFLGRFAEWNHDIKVDDVVEKMRRS